MTDTRLRLTHLRIRKFRNAAPAELHFGPGHNVLLGRNGTGKTNLLKLIAGALRGGLPFLEEEEFDVGWTLELGDLWKLDVDVRQEEMAFRDAVVRAAIQGGSPRVWHVDARLSHTSGSSWTVSGSPQGVTAKGPDVNETDVTVDELEPFNVGLNAVIANLGVIADEGELFEACWSTVRMGRLDEGIDAFRWLVIGVSDEFDPAPPMPNWVWYHKNALPFRGHVAKIIGEAIDQRLANDADPATLRFGRADFVLADRFCDLTGFAECSIIPEPVTYKAGKSATYRGLRFEVHLPSGVVLSHDHLSYGQRRLLAFLYQLDACPDFLVADELVNGFHYTWLERAMEFMEGRQTFLTSQNPLLLDHLTFETAEDVQRTFVLCRTGGSPEAPAWHWSHPTDDEAAAFKSAYNAGIQHVGELLKVHGLW